MRKNTNLLPIIIVAVILAIVLIAAVILLATNVLVGGHLYPKRAEFLNLRNKEVTLEEYDQIHKKLPKCDIYWNVPLSSGAQPESSQVLKISSLTEEDVKAIGYFENLLLVEAEGCTDYAQLQQLRERYPDLVVRYTVAIGGGQYPYDATEVVLETLTDEDISLMRYLPNLEFVQAGQCRDYDKVNALKAAYPDLTVATSVTIGGKEFDGETTELMVSGITDEEAEMLGYLPKLTKVTLQDPAMTPEKLFGLQQTYPHIAISWEVNVLGATVSSDATELELMEAISPEGAAAYAAAVNSNTQGNADEKVMIFAKRDAYPIPDMSDKTAEMIAEVEKAAAYLPNLERVSMRGAFLDNEAMAAFREAHRQDYKVVWTVECDTMVASTDTTYFMPYKFGVAYFFDRGTYNLRYCEDMIAIDLGHMVVQNVEFAAFMPHLKYLILAHTRVQKLTGLENCKELVFLEVDWSEVKDFTPLLGCTALEDLNIGNTGADIAPILQMNWLKHIWAVGRGPQTHASLRETFQDTDTVVLYASDATVGGGWRELPNYFAMRDALNMHYMVW